jgi:hypothetical protein
MTVSMTWTMAISASISIGFSFSSVLLSVPETMEPAVDKLRVAVRPTEFAAEVHLIQDEQSNRPFKTAA